jgi:cell wall-associated NlpC family hydrolase
LRDFVTNDYIGVGYMKKYGRLLLASLMTSVLVVTPVYAKPQTESLESQKAAAQSEADSIQKELVELLDKMGRLEENLIAKGEEISQAEQDLQKAKEQEEEQYEALKLRIKYMYEGGMTTALETLVSAQSFTDLLNKAEYVAEVHNYDRLKLQEYEDTRQSIEDLKTQLEEDEASMRKLQTEYETEEATLTATLEEKREQIAGFEQQIQAAAEEAARKAAERERQKQQEQQRQNGAVHEEPAAGPAGDGGAGSGAGDQSAGSGTNTGADNAGTSDSGSGNASNGNTSAAQTIVNAAYGQLGVPYVYGGNGNGGWDCSGLVQYCHSAAGISLPRVSQAQGGCGVAVSNPLPGDIVCYGNHVGIYIGGGQMIHAPKPGDVVKVAAVYGSPWYRRCW